MTTATQRHNGRAKRANGHAGHGLNARLTMLKGDLGALQRDMRGLVSDVGDAAESQIGSAVNGTVKTARKSVKSAKSAVESWGNQNVKTVRQTVRKQPVIACMIAAGAGALLGMCLSFRGSRRRRDESDDA